LSKKVQGKQQREILVTRALWLLNWRLGQGREARRKRLKGVLFSPEKNEQMSWSADPKNREHP